MLNTDQHNQGVKKRMTEEDYMKNLRGTNEGGDFPKEILKDIFDSIKSEPI